MKWVFKPNETAHLNEFGSRPLSIMKSIATYIRLMRPANIITTLADVLLGYAVSGMVINIVNSGDIRISNGNIHHFSYLILSSSCLYAGGVIFNDLMDVEWDLINNPDKPIPSGRANKKISLALGIFLTLLGIAAAFTVSYLSGTIAILITIIAFLHNTFKSHINIGGLLLGMCRSLNLLLGMSIAYATMYSYWYLALIPITYIGAVALLSGGSLFGSEKNTVEASLLLLSIILLGILTLTFLPEFRLIHSLPFLLIFAFMTFSSLIKAFIDPQTETIRIASNKCIHSLFILEAAVASGFAGYEFGVLILLLLPFSIVLSRILEEF